MDNTDYKELLREVYNEWFKHKKVQDSLSLAATLHLSHPHMGIKISKEFGEYCSDLWNRVEKALEE